MRACIGLRIDFAELLQRWKYIYNDCRIVWLPNFDFAERHLILWGVYIYISFGHFQLHFNHPHSRWMASTLELIQFERWREFQSLCWSSWKGRRHKNIYVRPRIVTFERCRARGATQKTSSLTHSKAATESGQIFRVWQPIGIEVVTVMTRIYVCVCFQPKLPQKIHSVSHIKFEKLEESYG